MIKDRQCGNWDTHTHKFIQRLWDYVNSCWERRNKQSTEVYVDIKKQSEPGIPTWQSARAESGVSSEGLRTSVQPAATAGAAFLVNIATGKFHCKHTTPVNVQMSWEIHRLRRSELANVLVETYCYTTTWVSRYQKGKTSLDLYETRDDGVLGWQWHQLDYMQKKSAPRSRQITTPTPHHSVFTGRMLFLTTNQQCQSTEGKRCIWKS